jgi:hypothetical protein
MCMHLPVCNMELLLYKKILIVTMCVLKVLPNISQIFASTASARLANGNKQTKKYFSNVKGQIKPQQPVTDRLVMSV